MTGITPNNVLRHELIGLKVRVIKCTDKTLLGARGQVTNETKNTLTILENGHSRQVPKGTARFRFSLSGGTLVDVDGKRLVARPEDRMKMKVRHW